MGFLKLSAILALIVLAASAPANLEGSGDDGVRPRPDDLEGSGDVTRPRPDVTTEAPRMKETKCKCYVETRDMEKKHQKSHKIKLRDLMGKAANDIMVTFADSDLGCQEALAKCSAFCSGLGKQMAASQLSSQKHGRWSTADLLCFKAKSENPLSVEIISKLDSCHSATYLDEKKHHKHDKSNKSNMSAKLDKDDDDDDEEQKHLHSHEKKEKHLHSHEKKEKKEKHENHTKHNKSDMSNKSAKLEMDDDDNDEEEKHLYSHEKKEKKEKHEKHSKHNKSDKSNKSAKLEDDADEKYEDDDDDDNDEKHSNIWKHGKGHHQEVVAFTMTDSLCCKKSWRHYRATECDLVQTSPDGSGDDGVRPRPDELQNA